MAYLNDRVLDLGLNVLDTEATHIYICTALPATYAAAVGADNGTTQFGLANKNFGAGAVFGSPADRAPNGRKVTTNPITDGSITTGGDAAFYAVVDAANSRLLAAAELDEIMTLVAGNSFTLPAFDIAIPDAV